MFTWRSGARFLHRTKLTASEMEFRAAIASDASNPQAHLGLAKSLAAQKKPDLAATEYATYLTSQPTDNQARLERVSALVDAGDDDADALADLDRAVGAQPSRNCTFGSCGSARMISFRN